MRVSQFAILAAASAVSISAVPTDYGNYGGMYHSCSPLKKNAKVGKIMATTANIRTTQAPPPLLPLARPHL